MNTNENIITDQSQLLLATLKSMQANVPNKSPIRVCVASKYASSNQIEKLYDQGFRIFGENKIQDGIKKISNLQHLTDIEWHFIGHLQRNKVKKAIQHFDVIQSVDSISLLEKINSISKELNKKTICYIQINIANDPKKFGFSEHDFVSLNKQLFTFPNVIIKGIMIIVPLSENKEITKNMFKNAYNLYKSAPNLPKASELSMGMSQDYKLAIEEGSTMVRIGRMLFQKQGDTHGIND